MAGSSSAPRPDRPWNGDVGLGVRAWAGGRRDPDAGRPTHGDEAEGPGQPSRPARGQDPEAVARDIVLRALTARSRTRRELEDRLRAKGIPDPVAHDLLDRFAQVGLVDDAAYARAFVESRRAGRGLAPRALRVEMRRKGLADDTVEDALADVDAEDVEASARQLVERKLRSLGRYDRETQRRRLAGQLARRGYSGDVVRRVVDDALSRTGRDDPAG